MKIKTLSRDTAEKLERAGDYAEDLTRSGVSSVEALAKAANKYSLEGEQGHLLVRGWNTARVRDLFESTKEAGERMQDLDVVDTVTFDRVRGKTTKKAAFSDEVWEGYSLRPDYSLPVDNTPPPKIEDITELERTIKQADSLISKKYSEYENTVKLASEELSRLRAEVVHKLGEVRKDIFASGIAPDVIRENIKVAHAGAYKIFCSIEDSLIKRADYTDYLFYRPDKMPYKSLIECAGLVEKLAKFEKKYEKLVECFEEIKKASGYYEIVDRVENQYLLDPTPGYPGGYYPAHDIYNPHTLLSASDAEEIIKGAGNIDFFGPGGSVDPNDPNNPVPSIPSIPASSTPASSTPVPAPVDAGNILKRTKPSDPKFTREHDRQEGGDGKDADKRDKAYKDMIKDLNSAAERLLGTATKLDMDWGPPPDVVENINNKMFGRHIKAVTRAFRVPGMVVKLMASDDILSNYSPKKVQEAFIYLHELAPITMENPAVAREFLRKYLEQGETLDSYDMKLLVDMESRRKKALGEDENW